MPADTVLRIETLASAVVHWSVDGWRTVQDTATHNTTPGVHVVDLPTTRLPAGASVVFTFRQPDAGRWEGSDFLVSVG